METPTKRKRSDGTERSAWRERRAQLSGGAESALLVASAVKTAGTLYTPTTTHTHPINAAHEMYD